MRKLHSAIPNRAFPTSTRAVPLAPSELARQLVLAEAGDPSSSAHVGAAAAHVCEKLSGHLSRLVGQGGIRTLLDRSLTLTRATFPWVPPVGSNADDSRWAALRASLEQQDAAVALEAFTTFVASFIGLFERLIGATLVAQVLHEVWPDLTGPKDGA